MTYDVRWLQSALNRLGFRTPNGRPLVVDGIKGPNTDYAVVQFKKSVGLRARPYVGPITMAALRKDPTATSSEIPWLTEGLAVLGLHEGRNTARLMGWFDRSVSWIDPREIPWCGAFVATVMRKWDEDTALPKNPLGAKNWSKFGEKCDPALGAILTFHRGSPSNWQGHVGFYLGESDKAYYILGGNQRNAVTKTWISKNRFHSSRWPLDFPMTGKRIFLDSRGQPLSVNEA